eukprot:tig00000789_g4129.t1
MAAAAATEALEKKVRVAFDLFDRDQKGVIDVREVGTVVRSLGVNPSEAELRSLIDEVEEEEPTGFIKWEKFKRMMMRVLTDDAAKFVRDSRERIVRAFQVFDPERKGFVTVQEIKSLLLNKGERFRPEEADEFISFATSLADRQDIIYYEDYALFGTEDRILDI